MALLSEHVKEPYGAGLVLRVRNTELLFSLFYEAAGLAGLAYAGKIALHICHEARYTYLAEALCHYLEGNCLTGTGSSSYQTVAVGHLAYERNRAVLGMGYVEPALFVVHISCLLEF